MLLLSPCVTGVIEAFGANQVVHDRLDVVRADRSLVGRDHLVDDFLPGLPGSRKKQAPRSSRLSVQAMHGSRANAGKSGFDI